MDYYDRLKAEAIRLGCDFFGVAETSKLTEYISDEIAGVAAKLPHTVSIAVRIQRSVLDTLIDGPNFIYKAHYRQANNLLDKITFGLGQFIQTLNYRALPIPASVITDWKNQRAHISHRHAAKEAGIGFLGRHGLVVHPRYGAAIRLASLLTDIPLRADSPLKQDCSDCVACIAACPVDAISIDGIDSFNGKACYELLKQFEKKHGIGVMICGLCLKSCRGPNHD